MKCYINTYIRAKDCKTKYKRKKVYKLHTLHPPKKEEKNMTIYSKTTKSVVVTDVFCFCSLWGVKVVGI